MSDDALDAKNMSKGYGMKKGSGMAGTEYTDHKDYKKGGKDAKYKQKMKIDGDAIGALMCAEERGIPGAPTMELSELVEALSEYDDFQAERVTGRQIERDLSKYNGEHQTDHCHLDGTKVPL